MSCNKCGSDDVLTWYVPEGALIDSSSHEQIENEFVTSSEYDYFWKLTANKEHLRLHCQNCSYGWRENIVKARQHTAVK